MRLILALLAILSLTAPARADDISAAGRGVVRIVTIAVAEDEVVGFGHGSGFAVSPTRIVTNAHVVELAARYPGNVVIGVVPSDGDKSVQGRLIAVDTERDLALIEVSGLRLSPLAIYAGPVSEGEAMVALGYPGNVDLATARSAADFIAPTSPVRSQGVFSGRRGLAGTDMLLHTASIARGNSGGPLLDMCGRVLGVNSALTRGDDGDASFALAIADTELLAFLREAKQPVASVGTPCMTMAERLAADRQADEDAQNATAVAAREAAAKATAAREAALAEARADAETRRENYMAGAALLLVLGGLALGGAGLLTGRGDPRWRWAAAGGGVLMAAAVATFLLRPGFDAASVPEGNATAATATKSATGPLLCRFDAARSRVTVSQPTDTRISWGGDGCINGRTQYAEDGRGGYERVLVPDGESTVSVLAYRPTTQTYTNTRYFLDAARMADARRLRGGVGVKVCTDDGAARANLAGQQAAVRAALPPVPNEKLVYSCRPAG
ncbi:S1C family serine protease [Sphingomonas sp. RS2018]